MRVPVDFPDSLLVGNPMIDRHHREIYKKVQQLNDRIDIQHPKQDLGPYLAFLILEVIGHFGHEERFMQSLEYPGLVEHKKAHDELTSALLMYRDQYQLVGPTDELFDKVTTLVAEWFEDHITFRDKQLADWVKSRGAEEHGEQAPR